MSLVDEYNKMKQRYEEEIERKHQEMMDKLQEEEHERIRKIAQEAEHNRDAMYWNNIKEMYDNIKGNLGDEDIAYALCAFIYALRTGSSYPQFYESLASVKRTLAEQKKQNKKS